MNNSKFGQKNMAQFIQFGLEKIQLLLLLIMKLCVTFLSKKAIFMLVEILWAIFLKSFQV